MSGFEELQPPEFHMWLCGCRQLMAERPADGGWHEDRVFADGNRPRAGWNKHVYADGRVSYVLYDPENRHADQYRFLPEGVDEAAVNVIRPALPKDARKTSLWVRTAQLAERLPHSAMPPGLRKPKLVMKAIGGFAALPRTAAGLRAVNDPILAKLLHGIDLTSSTGADPALRVVTKFMKFELPGVAARYLLSGLYEAMYQTIPTMVERRFPSLTTMLMRKVEDVADAGYRLFRLRQELNVAGFFNATYLATLCCGTVITMCSDDADRLARLRFSEPDRARLRRLRQNADELAAHYLLPAFELPARFFAKDVLEWVQAVAILEGREPQTAAEECCLHPALAELLSEPDLTSLDDGEVQARYEGNVTRRPGLSIDGAIEREARALRINLHTFLS